VVHARSEDDADRGAERLREALSVGPAAEDGSDGPVLERIGGS
jgi:hypothetical protein